MTKNEIHNQKEELLKNISEIFLKYGLRSTSMDDISNHLKISKKTLYQHFTNKDDVVEQVIRFRRENKEIKHDIEKFKRHNSIEMMVIINNHISEDIHNSIPSNMFDIKKYHPDVYDRIKEESGVFIHSLMTDLIEKGIKDGFFRSDLDVEVQVYLFTKQMGLLAEPETKTEVRYPLNIIISTVIFNFVRSISTIKGLEELEKVSNRLKKENNENNK